MPFQTVKLLIKPYSKEGGIGASTGHWVGAALGRRPISVPCAPAEGGRAGVWPGRQRGEAGAWHVDREELGPGRSWEPGVHTQCFKGLEGDSDGDTGWGASLTRAASSGSCRRGRWHHHLFCPRQQCPSEPESPSRVHLVQPLPLQDKLRPKRDDALAEVTRPLPNRTPWKPHPGLSATTAHQQCSPPSPGT